jgi:SAM-dependent methyltransferase
MGDRPGSVDEWQERVRAEQLATTALGAAHRARYLFAAHWAAGRSAVDVCCGNGYGAYLLAGAGASHVVGVDIADEAVAEARRRYSTSLVSFEQADVTREIPVTSVQLAVCLEGIEHVENPTALIALVHSKLTSDGLLVVSTPAGEQSPGGHSGNPHHHREFTLDEFRALLGQHFIVVQTFFQWKAGDPYDVAWSPRQFARALVPVGLKSRLRRHAPLAGGQAWSPTSAPADALRYRPLPTAYLNSLPGLRYETPDVWLAVCRPRP